MNRSITSFLGSVFLLKLKVVSLVTIVTTLKTLEEGGMLKEPLLILGSTLSWASFIDQTEGRYLFFLLLNKHRVYRYFLISRTHLGSIGIF